jgi:hypothetical protein
MKSGLSATDSKVRSASNFPASEGRNSKDAIWPKRRPLVVGSNSQRMSKMSFRIWNREEAGLPNDLALFLSQAVGSLCAGTVPDSCQHPSLVAGSEPAILSFGIERRIHSSSK